MPAGRGEDAAERFAAAVEQGRTPGFHDDADLARELQIAAMLQSPGVGAALAPHPDARARAKQRLLAALGEQSTGGARAGRQSPWLAAVPAPMPAGLAADRTTPLGRVGPPDAAAPTEYLGRVDEASAAEPEPEAELASVTELPARAGRRSGRHTLTAHRSGAGRPGRRAGLVGSAALLMMVALASAGMFASRDALPGDALYPVKRAAEATGLALTFDDGSRARRHLDLAAVRLDEVERMVRSGAPSSLDPALVREAMQEFDVATSEGSRMLLADEQVAETGGVGDLRAWAAEQVARLSLLRSDLPMPVVDEADASIALLDRLMGRTQAIQFRSSCTEVVSGVVDDIGPLPAEGTCAPRPRPADSGVRTGAGGGRASSPGSSGATGDPAAPSDTDASDTESGDAPADQDGQPTSTSEPAPSSGPTSTSDAPRAKPGERMSVPVPLPMLPPITLPPLAPGMPSVTIG